VVMANSSPGRDMDLDSADQSDAVVPGRELITQLTRRREAAGLSQARVARLMRTSQSAVARFESGQHDPQLSTLSRYAGALGLELELAETPGLRAEDLAADRGAIIASGPDEAQVLERPGRPHQPAALLTVRQQKILQVVRDFLQQHGYPPSMREIAEKAGLASTSSVYFHISALQEKGYLHRSVGQPRTMELSPAEAPALAAQQLPGQWAIPVSRQVQEMAYIPVLGRIAAGAPVAAEQAVEAIFQLPRQVVGEGSLFIVKAVGDSMINAAITDGDWVVVRQQDTADDGDVVAALIQGAATVKTLRRSDGHVWLIPHNPHYAPIAGDEASILGKVVAVLRRV
jgi:repressor LexA